MSKPIFVFSIDTELGWDFMLYPEHKGLDLLQKDPRQGRTAIDLLADVLGKYNIPATWAIVGGLLLDSTNSKEIIHRDMPQFNEGWLDWDVYISNCDSPLYCGIDIIGKILDSPVKHEIGLHSLFHMPFHRCSHQVAEAEVEVGIKAAQRFGINPKSFVFPYDKIGHVDVLAEHGFQIYRAQTYPHWDDNQKLWVNLFHDAIGRLSAHPALPLYKDGIWQIPGSVFFCDEPLPFTLPYRAKRGLSRTIREGKVFHVWLHDRDLLAYSRLSEDLDKFLRLVSRKRDEGKLEVMTMGKLAAYLENGG